MRPVTDDSNGARPNTPTITRPRARPIMSRLIMAIVRPSGTGGLRDVVLRSAQAQLFSRKRRKHNRPAEARTRRPGDSRHLQERGGSRRVVVGAVMNLPGGLRRLGELPAGAHVVVVRAHDDGLCGEGGIGARQDAEDVAERRGELRAQLVVAHRDAVQLPGLRHQRAIDQRRRFARGRTKAGHASGGRAPAARRASPSPHSADPSTSCRAWRGPRGAPGPRPPSAGAPRARGPRVPWPRSPRPG